MKVQTSRERALLKNDFRCKSNDEDLLVVVGASVGPLPGQPNKSIERKLPLEGGQPGMAEVLSHYLLHKLLRLVDVESATMRTPGYNVSKS